MDKESFSRQLIFDVIFGIMIPIICLVFDPIVFRGNIDNNLAKINLFAYSSIGIGIITLSIWLLFKIESNIINSLIAGVLLTGAILAFALGIVILPYSFFGMFLIIGFLGFTPFLTSFVFLRNGIRAIRQIQHIKNSFFSFGQMLLGIVLVIGISLGTQSAGSNFVSHSFEVITTGEPDEVSIATKNLRIAFWCSTSCYDELVWSYYKEETETQRQLISNSYRDLTGEDLEQKLYHYLALRSFPSPPSITDKHNKYYNQGLSLYESENYDKAILSLSTAIELNPEDPYAYLVRGAAYRSLSEYEKSLQDTAKVLELDPQNADAHHLRGLNFFNIDRYEESIAEYTVALQLDEYNKSPLYSRAFVYQNVGEYELALNDLEQYLLFVPNDPNRARIDGQIEWLKTKIEK